MNITLTPLVMALLSGGLITAVAALGQTRAQLRKARQDDERLPAEVESLWLGGAEKAVGLLGVALDRAQAQITQLDAALERERKASTAKDQRISDLEDELGALRRQLFQLQHACDRLGVKIAELKDDEEGHANDSGSL